MVATRCAAFASLDELNDWLERECLALWRAHKHTEYKPLTVQQCLQAEHPHLMQVSALFDDCTEHSEVVSSTCLVTFECNKYSVPASFANRRIRVRVYPDHLDMIAEGRQITAHQRVFSRDHSAPGQVVYNWRHYLLVAQRKPGSLRNGAPFQSLPDAFKQLKQVLTQKIGGDLEMVDILALVLHSESEHVEQEIAMALQSGCASKDHIINCLH